MPGKIRQYFRDKKDDVQDYTGGSGVIGKLVVALLVVYLLIAMVLGIYWSSEPEEFEVKALSNSASGSVILRTDIPNPFCLILASCGLNISIIGALLPA